MYRLVNEVKVFLKVLIMIMKSLWHEREGTTIHDSSSIVVKKNFRLDLLDFEDNLDPNNFHDWLSSMKRVFEYNTYDDEKKIKVATLG